MLKFRKGNEMGNKKFHYQDKKKDVVGGEVKQNTPSRQNGRRRQGNSQRGGASARRAAAEKRAAERYPAEKLALPLAGLGVQDDLCGLLSLNGIRTAGDVASRTEKEMYKIQGFNKKMLIALKRALESVGMSFDAEAQPEEKPEQKTAKQQPPQRKPERIERVQQAQERKPAKEKEERPRKPAAPLPVEEWRKIQKSGKWGFYDGFNTVIPAMYDEVFFFKEGLAGVELEEKCGFINPENEVVIPLDYESVMSFSEGFASVVKGGKCGYINKDNEVVIPFVYDAATPFEEGEAKVKKDGRWGTLFPDGTVKWI